MWELDHKEVWAPKNCCFWTMVWKRLLRVPCTARRSNQSILGEISPEYSLEGLMLKVKLQSFGTWCKELTHWKRLMLGKFEGRRRRGQQRMRWLDGIIDSMNMFEQTPGDGEGQGSLVCCGPLGCEELEVTEQLNNSKSLEVDPLFLWLSLREWETDPRTGVSPAGPRWGLPPWSLALG